MTGGRGRTSGEGRFVNYGGVMRPQAYAALVMVDVVGGGGGGECEAADRASLGLTNFTIHRTL